MSTLYLLFISIGLAMDAFAVSISTGAILPEISGRHLFRFSFHFGLFQFLMPIIGWFVGQTMVDFVKDYDHWIAFGLLSGIGLKMILDTCRNDEKEKKKTPDPTRGITLVLLSIATSIDALAVGISIACISPEISILRSAVIIGLVCALFSILGLKLGKKIGETIGKRAELLGGIVLIIIGIKILIEHTL